MVVRRRRKKKKSTKPCSINWLVFRLRGAMALVDEVRKRLPQECHNTCDCANIMLKDTIENVKTKGR